MKHRNKRKSSRLHTQRKHITAQRNCSATIPEPTGLLKSVRFLLWQSFARHTNLTSALKLRI